MNTITVEHAESLLQAQIELGDTHAEHKDGNYILAKAMQNYIAPMKLSSHLLKQEEKAVLLCTIPVRILNFSIFEAAFRRQKAPCEWEDIETLYMAMANLCIDPFQSTSYHPREIIKDSMTQGQIKDIQQQLKSSLEALRSGESKSASRLPVWASQMAGFWP